MSTPAAPSDDVVSAVHLAVSELIRDVLESIFLVQAHARSEAHDQVPPVRATAVLGQRFRAEVRFRSRKSQSIPCFGGYETSRT